MEKLSENKCFGGWHQQYRHRSSVLNCPMRFAIYLPPAAQNGPVPVLYWLSGLTCTDENFMQKAGAFRKAAELGIAIVAPDTSPRGESVADDDSYDLGQGAGFYLNATQPPWDAHYRMYDYVVSELPTLIEQTFAVTSKRAIAGHSMGGHGAFVIALRNVQRYTSVSAFSPICNPVNAPWGQKAFSAYLGESEDEQALWRHYDSCELLHQATEVLPMRIDQGEDDTFLDQQLMPDNLQRVAAEKGCALTLNRHPGYDHSYFFISSFIEEHLAFHAGYLFETAEQR